MPIRDQFLVFGQPVIGAEEVEAVTKTLESKWIGTGPQVDEFERRFQEYIGGKHSVAVNSCTAGLHLAIEALELPPASEIITSPMTFCATVNAIIHAGCTPVFCDVDPETRNITPSSIETKITSKTSAILPVHFAGYPCDMPGIMELARDRKLRVIEDCAHAIETTIDGRHMGTFGDAGVFSFYVTKNITTSEGGMVITNNSDLEKRIKVLALHGMSQHAWKRFSDEGYKHYDVVGAGYKYNMTDLQGALGNVQMSKIELFQLRRKEIWEAYQKNLKGLACRLPPDNDGHAHHLYCIKVLPKQMREKKRDQVLSEFHKENIGTAVHYQALNTHQFYKNLFGCRTGDFPNAEEIGMHTVSLPLSPGLSDQDVSDVINSARKVLSIQS